MTFDPKQLKKYPNTYETKAPAPVINRDMQAIAAYDRKIESQIKRANTLIRWGIIGGIITFLVSVGLKNLLLFGFLCVPCIGLTIFGGIWRSTTKGIDIPDVRYKFVPQVLEMLERDMAPEAPFHLKLNCTPTTKPEKKVETVPYPLRKGWKTDKHQDTWMTVGGTFVDGTDFSLTITEMIEFRYGWKRGRSGKRKYKRKQKNKGIEVMLDLQFPRKRYGAIQLLQEDVQGAVQFPHGVQLKRIKISDRSFTLGIRAFPNYSELRLLNRLITQLLLTAYHVLNLARHLSKQPHS